MSHRRIEEAIAQGQISRDERDRFTRLMEIDEDATLFVLRNREPSIATARLNQAAALRDLGPDGLAALHERELAARWGVKAEELI